MLLDYIGKHLDAIRQKLPPKQQNQLALLTKSLLCPEAAKQKDLSPPAKAARQWSDQSVAGRSKQVMEEVGKAKRLEDLGIDDSSFWEVGRHLGEMLPDLVHVDREAARAIFFRLVALAEDSLNRGQSHYYVSDGSTLASEILEHGASTARGARRRRKCWSS